MSYNPFCSVFQMLHTLYVLQGAVCEFVWLVML